MAPSAEQIIAGVVLSERLAVTMYGAVHRAQHNGQRNLRGLIVDPKMLAEHGFRIALTDTAGIDTAIALDHPHIVATAAVESEGPDVVVVTRGVGRFVTVQDLLADARVRPGQGGKLPPAIAALIGKAVVEALAAAHRVGVVHGAVHPRSVLIDEDGHVRLGDFVVGRALTTAVAAGADASLWRGLAGFLASELVVGEDPTPAADVFAVGAMMFLMLSGEVPPGSLNVTPAVERLVQRALDTDTARRYRDAGDLLDNLVEAFEDDHWELASRGELIKFAGIGRSDTNLDDATEDLLASLGGAVQAPTRPSMDMRAQQVAAAHAHSPKTDGRLDALLADLDEPHELTQVEDMGSFLRRDPVSELISLDPQKHAALLLRNPPTGSTPIALPPEAPRGRRAHLYSGGDYDGDESTPLPAPQRDSDVALPRARSRAGSRASSNTDEAAALDAIAGLDAIDHRFDGADDDGPTGEAAERSNRETLAPPMKPSSRTVAAVKTAASTATEAAAVAEAAAARAEAAAARVEPLVSSASGTHAVVPAVRSLPRALPVADLVPDYSTAPPRLKSRAFGVIALIALAAAVAAFVHFYQKQETDKQSAEQEQAERDRKAAELSKQMTEALPDPGTIKVTSVPPQAGVWLKLGRTPLDSLPLDSGMMHELRVELDGYQAVDTQVIASNWGDNKGARKATIVVPLKPVGKDPKTGKSTAVTLPAMPPKPPEATGFTAGRGPIHVDSEPKGAEVWMYIGMTDGVELSGIQAGLPYELRLLSTGFLPGYASIAPDDWRINKSGTEPINVARKKTSIDIAVELQPDKSATPTKGKSAGK